MARPTTSITVRNQDGGATLGVSFGWNQPYFTLAVAGGAGSEITMLGAVKEIYLSSTAAGENPEYLIFANLGMGAPGGV